MYVCVSCMQVYTYTLHSCSVHLFAWHSTPSWWEQTWSVAVARSSSSMFLVGELVGQAEQLSFFCLLVMLSWFCHHFQKNLFFFSSSSLLPLQQALSSSACAAAVSMLVVVPLDMGAKTVTASHQESSSSRNSTTSSRADRTCSKEDRSVAGENNKKKSWILSWFFERVAVAKAVLVRIHIKDKKSGIIIILSRRFQRDCFRFNKWCCVSFNKPG